MKTKHFLLFSILLWGIFSAWRVSAQPEKPNVIIIMADDLGWADIGIQNEAATADVATPHIDKLIRSGLRFTNGYVANATCGPSRASMMTGRTSSRFRMEDNNDLGVPSREILVPQILKRAGYTSGIIGKWHLGHEPEQMPLEKGFDEFYGFPGGNHHYFSKPLISGTEEVTFEGYLTDVLADKAGEFIQRNQEGPFFLYAAFNAPHSPMMATQTYLGRVVRHQPRFESAYEKIKKIKGRNALPNFIMSDFRSPDADPEVMRLTYCAMVAGLDDGVGKIMAAVDQAGIRESTLVVFLSDNGAALARPTDFGGVNLPLRNGKGTIWDGGVRVVFGASWPGTIPAGGDYDGIVNATDLFTTTVELAGETVPDDRVIDGVNLIPYLTGEKKGNPHEHFFFRRHDRGSWSFRSGDFKWVSDRKANMQPGGALYKISDDESESTDVSAHYPEKKAEMMMLYEELTKGLPEPLRGVAQEKKLLLPKSKQEEQLLLLSDPFDNLNHPTRRAMRGNWKLADGGGLVCAHDEELFKKHNDHGPILFYDLDHRDAVVTFSFKATDPQAVTFTTNADEGHVFRFVINPDRYNARAFPPDGAKKSLSAGNGKLPGNTSGEWMKVSISYLSEQVVVRVGNEFEKTFRHPSYSRAKKNISISFHEGTFAIKNLEARSQ